MCVTPRLIAATSAVLLLARGATSPLGSSWEGRAALAQTPAQPVEIEMDVAVMKSLTMLEKIERVWRLDEKIREVESPTHCRPNYR